MDGLHVDRYVNGDFYRAGNDILAEAFLGGRYWEKDQCKNSEISQLHYAIQIFMSIQLVRAAEGRTEIIVSDRLRRENSNDAFVTDEID
ncbi:hypothetical protein EVAR_51561_1 [Eumeta japonica]|uniref:Uncharacterized protein n=1 Tax=Eumeta variegata TaxID=151549 RepID=A0A4C1YE40_EUMVA|nr:hypothetical protein EVAR_51561_1 [Eumeta japonica]